jgi:carbon-monoxide dehydrogenase medium subunit
LIPFIEFQYFEPSSIEEASVFLSEHKQAKVLAGGTDLLAVMREREMDCEYVVNIKKIPGLSYIAPDAGALKIGALTTISAMERSNAVKERYTTIYDSAQTFGTVPVRNMATLGGNICRASRLSDMVPPLLVLDSEVKIVGLRNEKRVRLEDFFKGPGITILKRGEILTEVWVPPLRPHTGTAFMKMMRTEQDCSKVSAAVAITVKGTRENQVCEDVKIAIGAVAPTPPLRYIANLRKAEDLLRGRELTNTVIAEAAAVAAEQIAPKTDIRSTAEYRKELTEVLVRRIVKKGVERAKLS